MKGRKTGGRDWVKGQSGNPSGPPKILPEVREIRRLSNQNVPIIIDKYMAMTADEIKAKMADPTTPSMELVLARVIAEAIKKGDQTRLSFLFDRLLGKQVEPISVEGSMHMQIVKAINKLEGNE